MTGEEQVEQPFSVTDLNGTFTPKPYSEDGSATYAPREPEVIADEPTPEVVVATEPEPPAVEPQVAPEPPAQPDFEEIFQQRLGMTIPEAQALFDEVNTLKQRHFVEDPDLLPKDDFSKEFLLTHNRGGDVHKYLEARLTDFSKMTAEEIVRYDIASNPENKGAPKSELQSQFRTAMKNLGKKDEMEPEQEQAFTERLEWKADRLREKHATDMKKFQIPERQAAPQQTPIDMTAQIEQNRKEFLAEPAFRDFMSTKKVAFGATEYPVDPEKVLEMAADFSQSFKYLTNPDGTVNHQKLIKWLAYLPEMDAIDTKRDENVAGKQALAIVRELKNPTDPATVAKPVNNSRVVEWGA